MDANLASLVFCHAQILFYLFPLLLEWYLIIYRNFFFLIFYRKFCSYIVFKSLPPQMKLWLATIWFAQISDMSEPMNRISPAALGNSDHPLSLLAAFLLSLLCYVLYLTQRGLQLAAIYKGFGVLVVWSSICCCAVDGCFNSFVSFWLAVYRFVLLLVFFLVGFLWICLQWPFGWGFGLFS